MVPKIASILSSAGFQKISEQSGLKICIYIREALYTNVILLSINF
jgi:hypothetical protein